MLPTLQRAHNPDATIVIRPVHPSDAMAIGSLIESLTPADRRYRFHGAVNSLPASMLDEMTRVDQRRHVGLVAVDPRSGNLIADARWVAEDQDKRSAEFALMVAPAWRRRRIGTLCTNELKRTAAQRGIHRLYGAVLPDNAPMLSLMVRCGFACRPSREGHIRAEARVRFETDSEPPSEVAAVRG